MKDAVLPIVGVSVTTVLALLSIEWAALALAVVGIIVGTVSLMKTLEAAKRLDELSKELNRKLSHPEAHGG